MRALQRAVTRQAGGKPFSPTVARKNRSVLWNVLEYAVEQRLIDTNPLANVKWNEMSKGKRKVDKRTVPNPVQARTLLRVVQGTKRSGPRLYAFFAAMYFAALRPEEAVALNKRNLSLPRPTWNAGSEKYDYGWGTLYVEEARPHSGSRWTDEGRPRDRRGLKSRAHGTGRAVPCPPELTQILVEHVDVYGYGEDRQLFSGEQAGEIPNITYTRAWRAARSRAFTADVQATPLAARPYDLRHAAVSTWLKAGIDPALVAEWAGHSVEVLYEVYAAVLDRGEETARRQVQAALGHKV